MPCFNEDPGRLKVQRSALFDAVLLLHYFTYVVVSFNVRNLC